MRKNSAALAPTWRPKARAGERGKDSPDKRAKRRLQQEPVAGLMGRFTGVLRWWGVCVCKRGREE